MYTYGRGVFQNTHTQIKTKTTIAKYSKGKDQSEEARQKIQIKVQVKEEEPYIKRLVAEMKVLE